MSAPSTTTTPAAASTAAPAAAASTTPAAAPAASGSSAAPAASTSGTSSGGTGGTFQSASLYVGDLHPEITEGLLFEMFNRVGPVASIRVCRDAVTRRSLGYAYVNFHDVQDAERALDTMQFTEIKGKACRIMWSQRDPSLRKSGVGNIFVKNLAKSIDNRELFDIFSMFGNILSCKVAFGEGAESKGYGYVHFETAEAAQEAVAKLNGATIEDSEISVTPFVRVQDRSGTAEWTNLYVKQFPDTWEDKHLTAIFEPFGTLASVFIKKSEEGKSTGFGFINYEDHESAVKALEELNGKTMEDPTAEEAGTTFEIYVSKGQKKAERMREIKSKVDAMQAEKASKFSGMNLFVKNLDETIDDAFLKETFAPFGTITSAKIVRDDANAGSPSKGFGFVCFSSPEEASRAVTELNGKILRSKPITVALHQRKEQRRAHLAATYAPRGMRGYPQQMGPGQQPMPYGMSMPYQQGFPQQRGPQGFPFNQQPGFAPRGQPMQGGRGGGQGQFGFMGPFGAGGMPMNNQLRRPMGAPMGGPQGQRRPMNQQSRGGPINGGRMQAGGPAMTQVPGGVMGGPRGASQQQGVRPGGARGQGMPPQMIPMTPQQMQGGAMPNQPVPASGIEPLDDQALLNADPAEQKNMIGERLYPLIYQHENELAGKITGMLLEMENAELLNLIESPDALDSKIKEALEVLAAHQTAGQE